MLDDARTALARFVDSKGALIRPLGTGLINRTFEVRSVEGAFVLQAVSPIFDPAIHENIHAVTAHLAKRGLVTPELRAARDGGLFTTLDDGSVWRLMTFIDGVCFDALGSSAQARAVGALVGRFHSALDDLDHDFVGVRLGVHDTDKHLAALRDAVAEERSHRLHAEVAPLAAAIAEAAHAMPPLEALPPRVCHGDPKISNVLFDGAVAVCLIDLDTLGPMSLAHELGDAWRSWCNPGREDAPPRFDMDLFAASLEGYRSALTRTLDDRERATLVLGVEWISLELAARFAADALRESYFGWDATRYATRGDHNLARAVSQLGLHRLVIATRSARAALLGA